LKKAGSGIAGRKDSRKKRVCDYRHGDGRHNCEIVRLNELLSNGNRIFGGGNAMRKTIHKWFWAGILKKKKCG
jgi:hypothetical protein